MTNKICDICKKMNVGENWIFRLSDDKKSVEYSGHKACVDEIFKKHKELKDKEKMSVDKSIKALKLS